MPRLIRTLSVILFMVLSSAHAQPRLTTPDLSGYSQVRYVSVDTGSDSTGDGSLANPWKTLTNTLTQITDAAQTKTYAVLIASGTYTGTGSVAFTMKSWVDLYGGYDPSTWVRGSNAGISILDGQETRRVMKAASYTLMDGFHVRRGHTTTAGGGIYLDSISSVTITNSFITDCSSTDGGGLYCVKSTASLLHCEFVNNSAVVGGGVCVDLRSSIQVDQCVFRENTAGDGAGLYLGLWDHYPITEYFSQTIKNCTFTANKSSSFGGGMFCGSVPLKLDSCNFVNNTAITSGGGFAHSGDQKAEVADCNIINNTSDNTGGGIWVKKSPINLVRCTVRGNYAKNTGGGLYFTGGIISVTDCSILDNGAYYEGGGVYSDNLSDLRFARSWMASNSTKRNGAGAYIDHATRTMMIDCVISGNKAQKQGSGLYISRTSAQFSNCIFWSNTATMDGGGLVLQSCTSPILANCVFTDNRASSGGGLGTYLSSTTVYNSVFWNDLPDEVKKLSSTPILNNCDITGGWTGSGSNNLDSDPLFVDAANGDFHLQETSPCIGKGIGPSTNSSVPTTDIDGDPRSGATCDIGADEFIAPTRILDWANY